jgi:hypothetical protein
VNAFWDYFWPVFAAGLVVGTITGWIASRVKIVRVRERPREPEFVRKPRRWRLTVLAGGLAVSIAAATAWHGPLGAADRFRATIERQSREALDHYEMTSVTAHLHRAPLSRRLVLVGQVDDWQSGELVRLFSQLPGVSRATWSEGDPGFPLILEAVLAAIGGFLGGVLIAYLLELRRRHNAQWTW